MLTTLRVLLIVQYSNLDQAFPWWIWLYAIVLELDHFGMDFIHTKINRFQLNQLNKMEAGVGEPGRCAGCGEKEK